MAPIAVRAFPPSTIGAPDRLWMADISSVATSEGWLYLAVIRDVFSQRGVGWATGGRPYQCGHAGHAGQEDDSVNVIRHHDEFVHENAWIEGRQFIPDRLHHPSGVVQPHGSRFDLAEQTGSILGYDRHEIGPGSAVIVAL
jgi:transposase InsO family protein